MGLLAEGDGGVIVLREDDPEAVVLLADGWRITAESWGARLTVADPAAIDALTATVQAVEATGWAVLRLLPDQADAVTVMRPDGDRIETEFTVTRASCRRRGLASAVKAYGIIDHVGRGHRLFGTGGASRNSASIRSNVGLGYVLEPRWLTLSRP